VFNYPVGTFRYKAFISYSHKDRNWRAGKKEEAKSLMSKAIGQLEELFETVSDRDPLLEQLMTARFLYWQQQGTDLLYSGKFSGIDIPLESKDRSCHAQANLVTQAILMNETVIAEEFTAHLLNKGYYEPRFIRVCRQYNLCQGGS
jgi:hypothetical protein